MRGLLDSDFLSGTHEVTMRLRPERAAWPVDVGQLHWFREEVTRLCQTWGGAGQPILPIVGGEVPPAYVRLLQVEQVDQVGGLREVDCLLPWPTRTHTSTPAATSASARNTTAAAPPDRPVPAAPAVPLSRQPQPPSTLLSSHTHDHQGGCTHFTHPTHWCPPWSHSYWRLPYYARWPVGRATRLSDTGPRRLPACR